MTTTTKTTAVMTRLDSDDQIAKNNVTFILDRDDPRVVYRTVLLDFEDWTDMGRPDLVTVTVEPGDALNPADT